MPQTSQAQYVSGYQMNVDYPASSLGATPSTVVGGTIILFGAYSVAVLTEDARDNPVVSVSLTGIYDVLKAPGAVVNWGDTVLWDNTQKVAYVSGGGYTDDRCIGKAVRAQIATDPVVRVLLNPYSHTAAG